MASNWPMTIIVMRILMISTNRVRQPMPVIPFGACLTAQAVEQAGHEVRFLDLMFRKNPDQALLADLEAWRPDVVGLSIRNIDTNDIGNPQTLADETACFVDTIQRHSQAVIVLGGAALGVMPRQLLRHSGAAWAILADGETIFPKFLAALQQGSDPAGIDGVICNGELLHANSAQKPSIRHCTVEDFSRWVNLSDYLHRMASVPVQTKRGCPFECIYCTYNMAEGREYRLFPPDKVVKAIADLARQGLQDIEFVDNVFNSPYEHALAVSRGLAAARLPVRLQSLELNPRFLSDDLLSAMEAAGFVGIGVTVESASDGPLRTMRKGYGVSEVRKAAQVVARHTIPCVWIFMFGGPGETRASVAESLEFATGCILSTDAVFFQIGVRIYPGTELELLARRQGGLTAAADEMLFPIFYVAPDTPLEWLKGRLADTAGSHDNFIVGDSIRLPLLQTILRLSYRLGLRPPLWRHTKTIRRVLNCLGLYRPNGHSRQ
jgi:radical SAM superfamily enzyme YgiQ (UPF0313 family)